MTDSPDDDDARPDGAAAPAEADPADYDPSGLDLAAAVIREPVADVLATLLGVVAAPSPVSGRAARPPQP